MRRALATALTVLALALGIGATSGIFAVVNGVLLRTLPYRDTDRLVNVWSSVTHEGRPRNPISPANFVDFQRLNTTLDGLEGYFSFVTPLELATDAGSEVAFSVQVTRRLFDLLGRPPVAGSSSGHVAAGGPPSGRGSGGRRSRGPLDPPWTWVEGRWLDFEPTGERLEWRNAIFFPWNHEARKFEGEMVYTDLAFPR